MLGAAGRLRARGPTGWNPKAKRGRPPGARMLCGWRTAPDSRQRSGEGMRSHGGAKRRPCCLARMKRPYRVWRLLLQVAPPDTGSVEGIAGEIGGQTVNGEEKPH